MLISLGLAATLALAQPAPAEAKGPPPLPDTSSLEPEFPWVPDRETFNYTWACSDRDPTNKITIELKSLSFAWPVSGMSPKGRGFIIAVVYRGSAIPVVNRQELSSAVSELTSIEAVSGECRVSSAFLTIIGYGGGGKITIRAQLTSSSVRVVEIKRDRNYNPLGNPGK